MESVDPARASAPAGTQHPEPPRPSMYRRMVRRIPARLRGHWMLPTALVAFVAVAALVFGGVRITPVISGEETVAAAGITDDIAGAVDLFDDSVEHSVTVDIPDSEYARMIDEYVDNGDKKWVSATVTIDGTTIENVGVRLKGNSTLMSLRGGSGFPGGEGDGDADGGESIDARPGGPAGAGGGPMGGMTQLDADDPTSLPLLLGFDEYVAGRAYQGLTDVEVRPGSPVINEAMALSLTAATGQVTQRFAYAVYSVNGGDTDSRLILEIPSESYVQRLTGGGSGDSGESGGSARLPGSRGYLYKARATSTFAYVGDDQSDYSDQFKQVNAEDSGSLQPVIDLLKWVDQASDSEFAEHLGEHVDVESLARYVATQNLLSNMDDMSGPGQNYYLWCDLDSQKFTVVSWDLNLAMQGDTSTGPHDSVSMSAPGGMPGPASDGDGPQGMQPPDGMQPPGGMRLPDGMQPPDGMSLPGGGDGGMPGDRGGSGMMGGNRLKERFLAETDDGGAFADLYESTYWDLFDQVYGAGSGEGGGSTAESVLNRLARTIPLSDGLSADDLASGIADMREWIGERADALEDQRGA